jgi:RHS repeat-associated protein
VNDLSPAELVGPVLDLNKWTHVTAIYDRPANMLKLYFNGALVASRSVSGTISWYTSAGVSISDSTYPYFGMIDEVTFSAGAIPPSAINTTATAVATISPLPTHTATSTPSPAVSNTPSLTPTSSLTPTITPTLNPSSDPRWGTGYDGSLSINSGATYNINTQNSNGRSCADGGDAVAYSVTTLGSTAAVLSATPSSGCLNPGDEILLINLQGVQITSTNTGNYEFLKVASINGNTVVFTAPKVKYYGDATFSDANIGMGSGQQKVMLMRVPNYNNVTVDGTLTGSGWNGSTYGLMVFRAAGMLYGNGTIQMNSKGYRGGDGNAESYNGYSGTGGGKQGGAAIACNNGMGGGGGYALNGTATGNKAGAGGFPYGTANLSALLPGSGGGQAGTVRGQNENPDQPGAPGMPGGGIVYIIGKTIDFTGTVSSLGGSGSDRGGSGSGGAIRVEGHTIAISNLNVSGGSTYDGLCWNHTSIGSVGRIAVYYDSSVNISTSVPFASTYQFGLQPTLTPTPTSVVPGPASSYGDGADGDLTIDAGTTFNISAQNKPGRVCNTGGDGVSYSVTSLSDSYAKLSTSPTDQCLRPGDEILLFNLQGSTNNYSNAGNYEFLTVGGVVGDTVYFAQPKTKFYGTNSSDDVLTGQTVSIFRVPNYNNVTIDGTLTTNNMLVFRVKGQLTGSSTGIIHASGVGYRGGVCDVVSGEGINGYGGFGGGLQGGTSSTTHKLGSGGGHATQGGAGQGGSPGGGSAYGEATLTKMYYGAGGGPGGARNSLNNGRIPGSPGGNGGGIIFILANDITFGGVISANGVNGGHDGGAGGAGGSVRIEGDTIALNSVTANGGSNGANGHIAVYYENTFSGTFGTPGYLQKQDTADTLFNADFETATLSQWTSNLNDSGDLSASDSADYWGLYGMSAVLDDNNAIYVQDDTPNNETQYRARFYLNPNNVTMAAGDILDVFTGRNAAGTDVVRIQLQKNGSTYQIRTGLLNDAGSWSDTNWYDISNNWTAIEIHYQAFAYSGSLTLWLDDVQKQSLTFIDNDTRALTDVRLGAQGIDTNTNGTLYFDDFESRRFSYIGTLPDPGVDDPTATNAPGWMASTYAYSATIPHAVTSVAIENGGTNTYTYDSNGNMTCRIENGVTYTHTYNAENRASSIAKRSGDCTTGTILESWSFAYDGDGVRVLTAHFTGTQGTPDSTTSYFMGGQYELKDGAVKKYYSIAGMMVAVNDGTELQYLLTDHLGSVVATTNASGTLTSQQRYLPFGGARSIPNSPIIGTDFGYTGQRLLDSGMGGIMDYKARFYSPYLNRFLQPDSIIPNPANPQNWNRYSYVYNRPLNFNDPSGHDADYFCSSSSDTSGRCTRYVQDQAILGSRGRSSGGGDPDVPLTTYPDSCGLVGWEGYCRTGDQMEDLYDLYQETDGWWNNYGQNSFSPVDFLALMTYYELQGMTDSSYAVDLAWQIMARKMLWLCQHIGSSCNGDVIPTNAIFNYVATRESAGDRYTAFFINGEKLRAYNEYNYSFAVARYIAGRAVFDPNSANASLGALPDWGNASMFSLTAQQELKAAQTGWCQTCVLYVYSGSDPAYFMTSEQVNYFHGR